MKKLILSLVLLCWVFFVGGVFADERCDTCPSSSEQSSSEGGEKKDSVSNKESSATNSGQTVTNEDVWINLTPDCLINGGCSFSIYDALDIRNDARGDGEETSVMSFVQDIIMALTGFIGTVVTLALIISGIYYLMSPIDSGNRAKAMKGIKYSLIGLVIVMASMVIIRLVQFIAKGGS